MRFPLGRFQPDDIAVGKIIKLDQTDILVDFDGTQSVHVPLSELSINKIQTPEECLQLNQIREFLVVGNYDGKRDISFWNCSFENSDRLYETVEQLYNDDNDDSLKYEYPVSRENIILHTKILDVRDTKILDVTASSVLARLQWFLVSKDHPPTVSFSIRQLEIKKAWERLRQLQAEDTTIYATVIKKNSEGAIVKIEGLLGFIKTYVSKHREELVVGEELPLKIIEATEESNRLVLNHLPVLLRLRQLRVGQVVSGTIRAVRDYGVIVDIGYLNALFLTSSSTNHPSQILKVNDQLKATILELDTQNGRVVLGN